MLRTDSWPCSAPSTVIVIDPCCDHAVHHGMPDCRRKALEVRVVDVIGQPPGDVYLVRFVAQVALDVVDEALADHGVQLSPLRDEHFVERGIVNMATVVGLALIEDTVKPITLIQERDDATLAQLG